MSDGDEGTGAPAVVVVEQPAPQYVTAGELDARMSEFEGRVMGELGRLGAEAAEARSAAVGAQDAADDAQLSAAVAVEVAVEAAETAVEASAEAEASEDASDKPAEPEKRAQPADDPETSGAGGSGEKKSGYGHPGWFGDR